MSDVTRPSGRDYDEYRETEAEAGVIEKAEGSARFKIGDTEAYAAVYGPRELHPRHLQDPKKGKLRAKYNMLPFSGHGERVRPGPGRRDKEISLVTEKALNPVVDLSEYPNSVVDVYVELPQTNAGSRCAGICAASIALADAGIQMKDMVPAIAVGYVKGQLVVDLDGEEEHLDGNESPDIPLAMIPSTGEITLLQMDGIVSKDKILDAIEKGKGALQEIVKEQRQALHQKYELEGDES